MKFKKDGKVYDLTEMRIEVCDKAKSCESLRHSVPDYLEQVSERNGGTLRL